MTNQNSQYYGYFQLKGIWQVILHESLVWKGPNVIIHDIAQTCKSSETANCCDVPSQGNLHEGTACYYDQDPNSYFTFNTAGSLSYSATADHGRTHFIVTPSEFSDETITISFDSKSTEG